MADPRKYSPEVRQRAVRLVLHDEHEHPSQYAAIRSVADKIGCTPETLRGWVRRAEVDAGRRDGVTSAERERLRELGEVRELRRANEILRGGVGVFRSGGAGPPTPLMVAFIDEHREVYGVESICRVLPIAPSTCHDAVAKRRDPQRRCQREREDVVLRGHVRRVWQANHGVYAHARCGGSCTARGSGSRAAGSPA